MATLDTYREELTQWKAQGMSKAMMLRKLAQEYGVEISKSTFYPYVENLSPGKVPDANAEVA
jgi:ribosomal protein L19